MSFFSDLFRSAFFSGNYTCPECGEAMEFEDEHEETLICPNCDYEVDIENYGFGKDEDYDALYPVDDIDADNEDEDYTGETYDEICGELDDYTP